MKESLNPLQSSRKVRATSCTYLGILCRVIAAVGTDCLDSHSCADNEQDNAENPSDVPNEKRCQTEGLHGCAKSKELAFLLFCCL